MPEPISEAQPKTELGRWTVLFDTIPYCGGFTVPYMMCNGWLDEVVEKQYVKDSTKVFEYVNSLIDVQGLVSVEQIATATGIRESEVEKILDGICVAGIAFVLSASGSYQSTIRVLANPSQGY